MATLNDRNERLLDANHRAERLIALGGDPGMARQIAAMELGLIGGDRVELEDRIEEQTDLPLFLADDPVNRRPLFLPGEMAEIPGMLTPMPGAPDRGVAGPRRNSQPPRL